MPLQPPTPEFLAAAHPEDVESRLPWRRLVLGGGAVLIAAVMLTSMGRTPLGSGRNDRPRRALATVTIARTR
jgi:hypothetical protein